MEKQVYNNLGLIVAMGKNQEIGIGNDLIWRIKEDLNFFKNETMNSYIIMGRVTYDSMPKNLKGRKYIVLSKNLNFNLESPKIVHHDTQETLDFVKTQPESKFLVVGGGKIYEAFLPYVSTMYITEIEDTRNDADTYFPTYNFEEWERTCGENLYSEDNTLYHHDVLVRKKQNKIKD